MAKPTKTADELSQMIADEVRKHPQCAGFTSISLYALAKGEIPDVNWGPAQMNYGTASPLECDVALNEIVTRYQLLYDMRG